MKFIFHKAQRPLFPLQYIAPYNTIIAKKGFLVKFNWYLGDIQNISTGVVKSKGCCAFLLLAFDKTHVNVRQIWHLFEKGINWIQILCLCWKFHLIWNISDNVSNSYFFENSTIIIGSDWSDWLKTLSIWYTYDTIYDIGWSKRKVGGR